MLGLGNKKNKYSNMVDMAWHTMQIVSGQVIYMNFQGLFLTSNKENKHSLHVGALSCEQMSSVTWKDVVDLDEIYLRSACKSPASNTTYLTLRSSHCRSTCRPAHMTPNFLFFVWRKLAVI